MIKSVLGKLFVMKILVDLLFAWRMGWWAILLRVEAMVYISGNSRLKCKDLELERSE